ncbi:MAG: 16S rRNA (adenine(1518)-N(6)/adenine(1519)-N(6))-dimethyltransferase RsmA [Thermodesulfobacteriota bacterium]
MISPQTLLRTEGLQANKALGQNFLKHPDVARSIVEKSGIGSEDVVLEIGPGLGSLTFLLAETARRVVAVEKDVGIAAALANRLAETGLSNVILHTADILRCDWEQLIDEATRGEGSNRVVIFGNLPYNISSSIVVRLVEHRSRIDRAVLMFQKELADRLRAKPGCRDYGRLTVLLAFCATVRPILSVAADSFYPRPKVDSEVVDIRFPKPEPHPVSDETALVRVVRAAFGNRRKTLKNSLTAGFPGRDGRGIEALLTRIGIDPHRRAETLDITEFIRLSEAISKEEPQS